ncbi:MAG: protease complex subunit PrcB family protein [Clostridium sp.]|nr:protease complex subunit PrcB family protein [Clostridium sp.]
MKIILKGKRYLALAMLMVMTVWTFTGCSASKDSQDKVRDLDFSVAGNMDIPEELKKLIAEKQQQPFKLTYSDEQNLFIAVGYGVQPTGGYSISVNELYLTENSIVINTELKGPEKGENAGTEQSFPYIVIKTEYLENPVVFQ